MNSAADPGGRGEARILEAGYRRYGGARQGPAHAVRSLAAHTLRRILGLRRPARTKVLPAMAVLFAYLPAVVFVGVLALLGRFGNQVPARDLVPGYGDYYGFIISAIVLFVAFVAPEALCPDRRSGVLSLYLASPLTRYTYLAGKALAVATVLAAVTVGPPLLLLAGLVTQGAGPDGPVEVAATVARIVASGAVVTALFTALSMAVASLTDRRAVAAAATLFLLVGSAVVGATLVLALGAAPELVVVSLTRGPFELVLRIYGESALPEVGTPALAGGVAAWTAAAAAVTTLRYRSLVVTR